MKTDDFLAMEANYQLNNKTYDGFAYWTYGRFQVIRYLDSLEKNTLLTPRLSEPLGQLILDGFAMLGNILFQGRIKKQTDLLIFNHERRVKEADYYECVYTERIAEHFANHCTVVERPLGYRHCKPVKTPNLVYYDWIETVSFMRALVAEKCKTTVYKKSQQYFKEELSDVITYLENACNIAIDKDKFAEIFTHVYLIYKYRKPGICKMVDKVNPKVILEVVSYNIDCMIATEYAKTKRIPTIELQHGVMGNGHIAYNYSQGEEILQFPDKVLLFSDYWKSCTQFPLKAENLIAVGYPFFEKKLQQYAVKRNESDHIKTILFVSQWIIGKELSTLAVELSELFGNDEVRIIYKLHPGEYEIWRENYPELTQNNRIEVIDNLEHNIYEYFAESDVQVGVFSTAIYEGLGFGLKTYIFQTHFAENMKELCEGGYAEYVQDAKQLKDKIVHSVDNTDFGADRFWEKNALTNIIGLIDKQIKH